MNEGIVADLVDLINNFDPAAYLPDISSIMGWVEIFVRLCVLAAPVIMLVFGLSWLLLPAKEANHTAGYRTYFGMGSVEAWRFTQKLAGISWSALGLVLSVVMFLVSGKFKGTDAMRMADQAVACILWEIGLMALCCIAINLVTVILFDRKGNRRQRK